MADEGTQASGIPTPDTTTGGADTNGVTSPVAAGTPAPPWYSTFADADLRGYAENHHWTGPEDAVSKHRDLERLRGVPAERLLKLPEKLDDANALMPIYDRLGRPKEASGYDIPIPAENGDPEFAKAAAGKFHEVGLNTTQAKAIATWWNETAQANAAAVIQQVAQEHQVDLDEVKREWGGQYGAREELGRRAVRELLMPSGLDVEDLNEIEDVIGTAKLMKFAAHLGEKLGGGEFIDGSRTGNGASSMSPEGAQSRITELLNDREWGAKVLNNPAGPEATELDRLQKIVASRGRQNG